MTRFNLPDISFAEKSVEEIETDMVTRFRELTGIELSNSDPRRKMLQTVAYGLSLTRNYIDFSAKQTLLSYAEDDFLDHLGEGERTTRLEPKAASCILRFEISLAPGESDVIPSGTRAVVNELFFATTVEVPVSSSDTYKDIEVVCLEKGEKGNGYLVNQINRLVDPLPWVPRVYNITPTTGGADWEDDDSYAERIRLSPESYSTAGSEDSYKYHAKSANQLIVDVDISLVSDGTIIITPLLKNGEIPTQILLEQVLEACSSKKVRPLTDKVMANAPLVDTYNIDLTYYIPSGMPNMASTIQANVNKAVDEYINWQHGKLGRAIDPDELKSRVKKAGAARIVLGAPLDYVSIGKNHVAKIGTKTITYGGEI